MYNEARRILASPEGPCDEQRPVPTPRLHAYDAAEETRLPRERGHRGGIRRAAMGAVQCHAFSCCSRTGAPVDARRYARRIPGPHRLDRVWRHARPADPGTHRPGELALRPDAIT